MQRRDFLKWVSLSSASATLPNLLSGCNFQPFAAISADGMGGASGKPLTVGVQPWVGLMGQYVAMEKDFFGAESVTVKPEYFPSASETNIAFLAGQLDLAWVVIPDAITLVAQSPSMKAIMVSDYSNGSDGILGNSRLNRASDLRGKKVSREDTPFAKIFLGTYLKQAGLTEKDLEILSLSASESAAAFAAGKVDAAVTYEPWLGQTVRETNAQIIFTTKETNILPTGLVAKAETIASRRADILKYLRAIDQGLAFAKANPDEAHKICAQRLGVTAAEIPPQLAGIRILDIQGNKEAAMNLDSPYSLVRSLQSGEQIIADLGLISKPVEAATLVDDSLVKSL